MRLNVVPADGAAPQAALELARRLDLPFAAEASSAAADAVLVAGGERLELREVGRRAAGPVTVDFSRVPPAPLLLRAAIASSRPRVIDATAGLGGDAFTLARAGCTVELIERSAVVAELLEDGLERARRRPELAAAARRMSLHRGDARELLRDLAPAQVVYLDPMYPRSGREGAKAKGMRLLRELLGGDEDAVLLLDAALRAAERRVVVKRPRRAPPLAGVAPSGSLDGRVIRFDLYAGRGARR